MTTYRKWSPTEKMEIVLAMLSPNANVAEICRAHGIHASQAQKWKETAIRGMKESLNHRASSADTRLRLENARLKKLVAEEVLVIDRMQETFGGTAQGKKNRGVS